MKRDIRHGSPDAEGVGTAVGVALTAYVSAALTGVCAERRREIDATVALVKQVCEEPDIRIAAYFPGDHTDPARNVQVSPDDVFRIDRSKVKTADVLIMLNQVPSVGVGQELNMAFESLLPVVLLVPEDMRISRMVRGLPSYKVEVGYRDVDALRPKLREVLRELRPRLVARKRAFTDLEMTVSGAKLRAHRENVALTREDLADAVGMTTRGLALLEDSPDREADPSLTQLRLLAAVLNINAADLV